MPHDSVAAFYTDPIILEFAMGVVIAKLWTSGVTLRGEVSLLLMLAGFLFLYLSAGSDVPRIIGLGIPSAMIVAGTMLPERRRDGRSFKPLALLGDASYSIYLSQIITLPVTAKLWSLAGLGWAGSNGPAFLVAGLIAAAASGIAIYLIVERPLFLWMSGRTTHDSTLASSSTALAACRAQDGRPEGFCKIFGLQPSGTTAVTGS